MKIVTFNQANSILNQYLAEVRNINIQGDSLRFRRNIERIGEIMAYEISRDLPYHPIEIQTPLAKTCENVPAVQPVLATILRAGLPLHQGFLNYFDHAEMLSFQLIANTLTLNISTFTLNTLLLHALTIRF